MSAVFISYRRDDSAGHTGRLYDHLRKEFGMDYVFRDIDTIEPGTDFVDAVEAGIKDCSTLLVVIGNQWLTAEDEMGRRLDDPNDFVRIEVASALKKKLRVIPVLVQGAKMPNASELPEDLAPLARRHALELSDSRWDYDMGRLITSLSHSIAKPENLKSGLVEPNDEIIPTSEDQEDALGREDRIRQSGDKKSGHTTALLSVFATALLAAVLIWQFYPRSTHKDEDIETTVKPEATETRSVQITPEIPAKETSISKMDMAEKNNLQIEQLLTAAVNDVNAFRLTSPVGENAFEKYNSILEIEPGHQDAIHGIRSIAEKYIGMAESALQKGDIPIAEKYLSQATTVHPEAVGIAAIRQLIDEQQRTIERQRAQHEAESERKRLEREAESARRQAEKEALMAREREAEKQALLMRERMHSCIDQCEKQFSQCQTRTPSADGECESRVKIECEKVQQSCLGNPQTALLWGDLGAESECLGKWSQCMRQRTRECEAVPVRHAADCEDNFSSCKRACQ